MSDSQSGSAGSSTIAPPCLNLYVIWAPQLIGSTPEDKDVSSGAEIAQRIYAHFCFDRDNPFFGGLGIPVYFRSVAESGSSDEGPPRSIDLDGAERSVVIVLIDAEMALDERNIWRPYLENLREHVETSSGRHLLLPVALDRGALHFAPLDRINHIRYFQFTPGSQQWLMLRLWLTNEIARHFRLPLPEGMADQAAPGVTERVSPPPVRIFLSHAKIDGRDEARELLDCLRKIPAAPFFDEVDIGPGYDIGNEIVSRIADAAVIVLLTDAYSDRPWCQKEILAAKRLQRPLVVVDDLRGKVYRSFPYLGNVPTIRKSPGDEAEILALALDEALRTMVFSRRMAQFLNQNPQRNPQLRYLLRAPEALDSYHLVGLPIAPEAPEPHPGEPVMVLYPDPPISNDELGALNTTLFSRYHFATQLHLYGANRLQGLTVGLSLSETPDFARCGLSEMHLAAVSAELARHLLAAGARLAYGGKFGQRSFTELLTALVATYNASGSVEFKPIENFQSWPYYLDLTRDREAELIQVAHVHRVPPIKDVAKELPGLNPNLPPDPAWPEGDLLRAIYLSQMREVMNRATQARIFLGGRTHGWGGIFPGILEELLLALQGNIPVFLLGGFGGCTRAIVDLLHGQEAPELSDALSRRPQGLVDQYTERTGSATDLLTYEGIRRFLAARGPSGLYNGLDESENALLFKATDTRTIIELLQRGLGIIQRKEKQ